MATCFTQLSTTSYLKKEHLLPKNVGGQNFCVEDNTIISIIKIHKYVTQNNLNNILSFN